MGNELLVGDHMQGNFLQNLQIVRWLANHASAAPVLLAAIQTVATAPAPPFKAKGDGIKAVIDALVPILDDCPFFAAPTPAPVPDPTNPNVPPMPMEAESLLSAQAYGDQLEELGKLFPGDGTIIKAIVAALPQILAFIQAIMPLFKIAVV